MNTTDNTTTYPTNNLNTFSDLIKSLTQRLSNSVTLKATLTSCLALLMLIPLGMVNSVVKERSYRYQGVLQEIANAWGEQQTLAGPVLSVPFTELMATSQTMTKPNEIDTEGKPWKYGQPTEQKRIEPKVRIAHFLPRDLHINTRLDDEYRSRSIFKSVVYRAEININAEFDAPDFGAFSDEISEIHWDKAYISVGISDTRSINAIKTFEFNGETLSLSPGTELDSIGAGFHGKLPVETIDMTETPKTHKLSIQMNVNGSGGFYFTPHGERTRVSVQSGWPHPSFQGSSLPIERRISADGFSAEWDVPHLARNYSQQWISPRQQAGKASRPNLHELVAGVRMFEPDSLYSRITRACKYGILFIGLTFLTLFSFELTVRRRVHPIQYALIGVSLSIFYLLLLSLSEHISFFNAYLTATATCSTMISVYVGWFLRSFARGLFVASLLVSLYALLYSLIKMEDYALLMGTLVLILVVATMMVLTRNLRSDESAMSS